MQTKHDLSAVLQQNPYPGRGIVLGRTPDDTRAVLAYFIMGRSENSRNRVFVPDGTGIRTQAFDPAKMTDPSLVIYAPVKTAEGKTIVSNGDQTDTIYDFLMQGKSFRAALRTREFEPDAPHYTPRISGILDEGGGYTLSILKCAYGCPSACLRFFYEYDTPVAGLGHFIHTYDGDANPLPSFSGEPLPIATDDDMERFAKLIWGSLNHENKVALFVRYIELSSGVYVDKYYRAI